MSSKVSTINLSQDFSLVYTVQVLQLNEREAWLCPQRDYKPVQPPSNSQTESNPQPQHRTVAKLGFCTSDPVMFLHVKDAALESQP